MATAATDETNVHRSLDDIFTEAFDLYTNIDNSVEPTNNIEVQVKIKTCIKQFEDATQLVSLGGLFSSNETYDEVATDNLKYFLLPFYLGRLTTKLSANDRKNLVDVADIYFKDFLHRCEEYGLHQTENETKLQREESGPNPLSDLTQMARSRNSKIEQYRRKKELDEQVAQLKNQMKYEIVDEDVKRNFYLKVLKSSIWDAKEEVQSIIQERQILEHISNMKDENPSADRQTTKKPPISVPLKPVIITKDAAQKAVFGLGYPSIPTMSVADFYDQRVKEGIFPDPSIQQNIPSSNMLAQNQTSEEEEKAHNEILEENDDPEYLARARAMDEFRDNVRRGEGNRQNRS